jgi:hypothetical protein
MGLSRSKSASGPATRSADKGLGSLGDCACSGRPSPPPTRHISLAQRTLDGRGLKLRRRGALCPRGPNLTTTQVVPLPPDRTVARCGVLQGAQHPSAMLFAGRRAASSPRCGSAKRSRTGCWPSQVRRRSPASSYLICSRGCGVVIYLGAFARRNQPARTTRNVWIQSRGRSTGSPVIRLRGNVA